MSHNRRSSSRRRYSQRNYKKIVIADKDEIKQERKQEQERMDKARHAIIQEAGYVRGYRMSQGKKKLKAISKKTIGAAFKVFVIVACAVLIVFGTIFVIPKSAKAAYTQGYEVLLNGTVLGVTSNAEPISNALESIRLEFREDYNMNVFDDTTLEYRPVMIEMQFICPPDFFVKILKECVDVKVMAWVILVNNAPAAAVKTRDEADMALERVLEPFYNIPTTRERIEVGFVENVEVVEMPIEYSQVSDSEYAYKLLRFGGDIDELRHTVVSGESLYSISKSYGVKVSDLRKANPTLASTSKIYPGNVLLAVAPQNRVNIKFVEVVNRIEDMDYETETIKDDSMLVTERIVVQEGFAGSHDINAEITYINGVEVEKEIISETILSPAINRIIRQGTLPVPKILELAATGEMPIPLKSSAYRISSKFGPRNIAVAGASKWHKGVDLAANSGTPIYASMSGTVTHSGSGTGYGLYIKINHGDGVETRYGHCSQLIAKKGDKVNQGDIIALVGNTGISGGSHLHFEVRIDGKAYDPMGEYVGSAP